MPKSTFQNLSEEKQEKIMRSSITEFTRNGFEKGNVGDIAKNAGVAKGSLYQYFENKKELFLYTVEWTIKYMMDRYSMKVIPGEKTNIFDFFYRNSKDIMEQIRQERELVIFMQDVFLGHYRELTDESMAFINRTAEEFTFRLIKTGKENGTIRKDIDDRILSLFITGVSFKIKEHIMTKARSVGEDILDEDYEVYEKDINAMLELLKNGMGGK